MARFLERKGLFRAAEKGGSRGRGKTPKNDAKERMQRTNKILQRLLNAGEISIAKSAHKYGAVGVETGGIASHQILRWHLEELRSMGWLERLPSRPIIYVLSPEAREHLKKSGGFSKARVEKLPMNHLKISSKLGLSEKAVWALRDIGRRGFSEADYLCTPFTKKKQKKGHRHGFVTPSKLGELIREFEESKEHGKLVEIAVNKFGRKRFFLTEEGQAVFREMFPYIQLTEPSAAHRADFNSVQPRQKKTSSKPRAANKNKINTSPAKRNNNPTSVSRGNRPRHTMEREPGLVLDSVPDATQRRKYDAIRRRRRT